MKYAAFIVVAALSLLLAVPLSRQPKQQPRLSSPPKIIKANAATVPSPAPAPVPPASPVIAARFECAKYKGDFEQYNWNADTAMAICQAESSGNPTAISNASINYDGVSDYGLMQLHGVDILDPAQNIAYAYNHKYLTQGWRAWSTFNSGAYAKYL